MYEVLWIHQLMKFKLKNTKRSTMKKLVSNYLFWLSLLAFPFFQSCDIIDNPVKENPGGGGGNGETVEQRVLIEKFTGHRCNNCPNADADVSLIKLAYGDRVSFISYHVLENFAGPNPILPTDFRTPEGNFISDFFQIIGIPTGMVNRIDYTASGTAHRKPSGAWANFMDSELSRVPIFDIKINPQWNASNRSSSVEIVLECVNNFSNDVEVVVSAIENGIVAGQLMPNNSINQNYVHESVFRFSYTPAMGVMIQNNWIVGDQDTLSVQRNVSADFDENNMKIVAYVKQASNQRILQVFEVPLLP